MERSGKIFVAGHRGMVGSALLRRLAAEGCESIVTRVSAELDLRNQAAVEGFFEAERPRYVFLAAAKVGGIAANNTYRGEFLYDNLMIQANVIQASHKWGVEKLLFLGSSCIYPRMCPQPIREEYLLQGSLEPTNEPYAIAKIAGLKMCEAYRAQYGSPFISAMPTNLYGPNDNYDLANSHVLPALIRKFTEAKAVGAREVVVWGTGSPRREFLHVDDLAGACVFLMRHYDEASHVNVGSGEDVTIRELAEIVKAAVGFEGALAFDTSKPDGTPRKLLDVSRLQAMGWRRRIGLEAGIRSVVAEVGGRW